MPRLYLRKTETKYKYNKTLSLGKTAITYSVPKSTIHNYLKQETIKTPKTGRKIFSQEQEVELEDHILKCCKQFYGLTIEMVRKIAFKFAEVNNLKHNFYKNTQMAGKDWFYGFKKRHLNISLRRLESTSINRITAFSETEVKILFNNLESLQIKYQFDANCIYNVDETGISKVQRNSRILASKGQKQVGMITSGKRGTTTIVFCAFSAWGNYSQTLKEKGPITPEAQMIKPINQIAQLDESIPLQEIVTVPQISQPKTRKTSRKRHSIIITSIPMKDALGKKKKKELIKVIEEINSKNKSKKGRKNLKAFENYTCKEKENNAKNKSKNQKEYYCLICNEKYVQLITEDWIMCYNYRLWAHEKCTNGESTSKGFVCDFYAN